MSEAPCSSKAVSGSIAVGDDLAMTLNIKDDEAEIARLQLPVPSEDAKGDSIGCKEDDDRIAKIHFECTSCGMKEMVHYYGQTPPFVCGVKFSEATYVMRDPFQPGPARGKAKPEYFVAMGTQCAKCERTVCKDAECSYFYTATFCLVCARSQMQNFPIEAQTKLRKQLAAT